MTCQCHPPDILERCLSGPWPPGFSVMGYSSVSFILSLIKYYGATEVGTHD